jgi:hypothetical protein
VDYEITCYVTIRQDLYHASRVYTGLCELSNQGAARIKFAAPGAEEKAFAESSYAVCMRIRFLNTGDNCLLAVDLLDRSDSFEMGALENCNIYLKRSYYEPDLSVLPFNLKSKVLPFGLNYACRSPDSIRRIVAMLVPGVLRRFDSLFRQRIKDTRKSADILWQFLSSPNPRAFECSPQESTEPTIVFQTRVWSPTEISENADEINGERLALVRALRRAFGSRFQGGLVPTAYAKEHYPEELSTHSPRHSQYAKWAKKHLIGINTRGLHHSIAFKLAEYLASSKCIVSCPLRNQLPVPLIEGQHYLSFRTPEECVDHCTSLLDNTQLAFQLRTEAWEYYRHEVEPAAHMRNSLTRSRAM